MKKSTIFILFLCVLVLCSCNSKLSTEKVEEIALIGATIEITQNCTDKKKNEISIDLFDSDNNSIRNDSITIIVNGVEEKLYHKEGLYYTDESRYLSQNVLINNVYNVEIKLTNGKKYLLGTINALSEEKIENIECDEQGDYNKNTVIKWRNLKSIDELSIETSVLLKSSTKNEMGYGYKDDKVKKISSNGEYTITKSEYSDSKSITSCFELKFRTTKFGKMNAKLLENSKITISTSIEKNINFDEENYR